MAIIQRLFVHPVSPLSSLLSPPLLSPLLSLYLSIYLSTSTVLDFNSLSDFNCMQPQEVVIVKHYKNLGCVCTRLYGSFIRTSTFMSLE
jgi:hypothetical protein